MKKTILITLCCASLMLITPLTGVAQENTVSNNLPEQPKDVEGLVAQIRTVVDEVLQRYGHIQIVKGICSGILRFLDNSVFKTIWRIFCTLLFYFVAIPLGMLVMIILFILKPYDYSYMITFLTFLIFISWAAICSDYSITKSILPFQSIYTMLETKDNLTQSFDGCPCL